MKNFKQISIFAFLCLLVFVIGGCGGSSNSHNSVSQEEITDDDEMNIGISGDVPAKSNDNPEVLRVLDKILATNENGVPIIFDYAPLPVTSDETYDENGNSINFLKYVSSKDLNENGEFVKTFALEKDIQYVIKYSHSGRNLNGSYLKFRITAPEDQVMILDIIGGKQLSSRDEELISEGVISKSLYVETKHEVISEESPCIMLYSFKAPLTGNYEFAVREATQTSFISPDLDKATYIGVPFEFRFYTAGESYSAADDEEKELSARKILHLQRILLNNATEFDENGLPISFENNDEYGSDKESTNNYLDSAYGVLDEVYGTDDSDKVIVAPRIDNVPYDSLYTPGAGFYAHSGLRSIQLSALYDDVFSDNAIDDFTIQKPQGDYSMNERINVDYASTDDEFYRMMGLDSLSDFTLLKNALDNKTRERAKLGLAGTKTLVLRYEYCESKPRMPEMSDIQLRSAVRKELKKDFNTFQREHGDYFVAGYTFGLFYEAAIEIQAEPYNCYYRDPYGRDFFDAATICDTIAGYIKKAFEIDTTGFEAEQYITSANDSSPSISEIVGSLQSASNVSVYISYWNHSGSEGKATVSSLIDLSDDLADFQSRAAQTSSSDYERLYATLIRYREIEEAKKYIPEELPITAEHYKLIRDLNKIIYLTRCYKNAVDSIPAAHLINGESKRDEWSNEFSDVFNLYTNQLNRLCSDIEFVRDYYDKFNRLLDKYQGLNHRYVFYRYFLARQKNTPNGVGDWSDSDDGWGYPHFTVGFSEDDVANNKFVKEDFANYRKGYGIGPAVKSEWDRDGDEWDLSNTFEDSARAYYYKGGPQNTNKSDGTDLQGHSLGKRSYHWKFERGFLRRIECDVLYYLIDMPDSTYPFVGLED